LQPVVRSLEVLQPRLEKQHTSIAVVVCAFECVKRIAIGFLPQLPLVYAVLKISGSP
jgi:hypothetical protein